MDNLIQTLQIRAKKDVDVWFNNRNKPSDVVYKNIMLNLGIADLADMTYEDLISHQVFISRIYIDKVLFDKIFYWLMQEHITTGQHQRNNYINLLCRTFALTYNTANKDCFINCKPPVSIHAKNSRAFSYSIKKIDEFKNTPCMLKMCYLMLRKYPDLIRGVERSYKFDNYEACMLGERVTQVDAKYNDDHDDGSWDRFVSEMKDSSSDGLFYLGDGMYL